MYRMSDAIHLNAMHLKLSHVTIDVVKQLNEASDVVKQLNEASTIE